MFKNCRKKIHAKPIRIKRFPFNPKNMFVTYYIEVKWRQLRCKVVIYIKDIVKNQLFAYGSHRAETWWMGSWHQNDTNNTPLRGGG